jgi:RNA polymerase sigma-70 factor (ECF subfamily)
VEHNRWFKNEVEPLESALRVYIRGRFPGLSDVDDIIQHSYERLFRARRSGTVAQIRPYLFAIARNAAADVFRRRKAARVDAMAEIERLHVVEDRPDAAETTIHDQEIELLHEAIRALPQRCREVFILRKLHGLSHRAIAEKLGLSVNTIEHHVSAGLIRCRQYLGEHGVSLERLRQARNGR